jgi:hypothetical protein
MTDKNEQWIWFINKENPKRISRTTLGTFLKDINKGLTTRNTSIQDAKKCVFLTRMDFDKPYIFFCTYNDAIQWKNLNTK